MSRPSQSKRGLARVRVCQNRILTPTQTRHGHLLRSIVSAPVLNRRSPWRHKGEIQQSANLIDLSFTHILQTLFSQGWFRSYHSLIDQIHWWAKEFFNYRPSWCIELILLVHGGKLNPNEWQNIQCLFCGHRQTWAHCCCYCSFNRTLAANVMNYCPSCFCQAVCHGCISSGSIDLSLLHS